MAQRIANLISKLIFCLVIVLYACVYWATVRYNMARC